MKKISLLALALSSMLSIQAKIISQPVAYEQGGVKLEGYLAYDDNLVTSGKKAPGVLVIPEWWGLNEYPKSRAEQLASLGYVAFVADMYGAGVTTTDPEKAGKLAGQFYGKPLMAERARAGLDVLLKDKHVDAARVAAIGYCFGGATVQALAYSGAPLAGVVSFHGSLIAPPAQPVSKAKFLICHGAIDGFITAEEKAAFVKGMDAGKYDYQFVSYAGAVHAFTNPKSDETAAKTGLKGLAYNAAADHRSWQHMRLFFDEIFATKKK